MSETTRVQRWREAKRQHGLKAVTIWLSEAEDMRLKDLALQARCSPSALVQQALHQFTPTRPQENSDPPDTSLIRQLIREELAAMQATLPPVTRGVTVMPTVTPPETPAALQADHDQPAVTETVPEPVTETPPETVTVTETTPPSAYDPEAATARMQALQAQGRTLAQIAATLTAEGVPTKQGRPWHKSTVNYLLKTRGR